MKTLEISIQNSPNPGQIDEGDLHRLVRHLQGTKTPQKFPANLAWKRRPNVEVRSGSDGPIGVDSGDFRQRSSTMPVRLWRRGGGEPNGTGHTAGGGRTAEFRREEGRQREREERESGERREKEMRGFPFQETLKIEIPQKRNFPKIPFRLPLTITFPYELRFLCSSRIRTRFKTFYNFRTENLFRFQTLQERSQISKNLRGRCIIA